jgi:hypothetical protein
MQNRNFSNLFFSMLKSNEPFNCAIQKSGGDPGVFLKAIKTPGVTPDKFSLNEAIKSDNSEIVRITLEAGAKPNKFSLEYAKTSNDPKVRELVDYSVKCNSRSKEYNLTKLQKILSREDETSRLL